MSLRVLHFWWPFGLAIDSYWTSKRNAVMAQLLWATACRYSEIAQMIAPMTRAQLVDLFNVEGIWTGFTRTLPSLKPSNAPFTFIIEGGVPTVLRAF